VKYASDRKGGSLGVNMNMMNESGVAGGESALVSSRVTMTIRD